VTLRQSGEQDGEKRAAAARAVEEVEDGMVFGLGSGSTAAFAVEAVAAPIANGLRVVVIPSSETAAALARQFGVPLTSFAKHRRIDVTIDGADQVERGTLNGIKGLGGALLREKVVASASDRMIVVIDETKLVDRLGRSTPLSRQDSLFWVASHARPPVDVRLQAAIAHDRRQTFKDGQQQLHHRLHHRRNTGPRRAGGPFFCHRRRWRGGRSRVDHQAVDVWAHVLIVVGRIHPAGHRHGWLGMSGDAAVFDVVPS
jgi:hypothetical protein